MTSPYLTAAPRSAPFWLNIYRRRDGAVEATGHTDEAGMLDELAAYQSGHSALRRLTYIGTAQFIGRSVSLSDRTADAVEYDREQTAAYRLDRSHARGCQHPGA